MTAETQQDLTISPRLTVFARELDWSFARGSGPGGQNVNKVSSKAILRWRPYDAAGLPDDVKRRFVSRYGSRLTNDGELIVESEEFRDQPQNIRRCLDKLREMIVAVAQPPRKRKPTKPTKGSQRRRLAEKKQRSETKQRRSRPTQNDF